MNAIGGIGNSAFLFTILFAGSNTTYETRPAGKSNNTVSILPMFWLAESWTVNFVTWLTRRT